MTEELARRSGFDSAHCAIAAALLDNHDLWTTVVGKDFNRDYDAYYLQKDSGATEDDLGQVPSHQVSASRILRSVERILHDVDASLAMTLGDRMRAWAQATR